MGRPKTAFFHSCFLYVLLYFYNVLPLFYSTFFIFCYTLFNIYQLNLTVKLYQICPQILPNYPILMQLSDYTSRYHVISLPRKIKTYIHFPQTQNKDL